MAKVTKHGSEWKFKREAYIGATVRYYNCFCEFVLSDSSDFKVFTGGEAGFSRCKCPECGVTNCKKIINIS